MATIADYAIVPFQRYPEADHDRSDEIRVEWLIVARFGAGSMTCVGSVARVVLGASHKASSEQAPSINVGFSVQREM